MNFNLVAHSRVHAFKAMDLHDYNIILRYSWLQVVNPDIDWSVKIWSYHTKDETDLIKIIDAKTFIKNFIKRCIIFIIISHYLTSGKPMTLFAATVSKNHIPEWLKNLENVFLKKKAANIYNPALIEYTINLELSK